MKLGLFTALVLLALPTVALAQSKHERDIQIINADLQTAHLTPAKKAQVIRLRNEGSKFHYAGQHGKAEVVLEKAKAILHAN